MTGKGGVFILPLFVGTLLFGCAKDELESSDLIRDNLSGPRPYFLKVPEGFPDYFLDEENRLSHEGIALGRRLFYDPILSRNNNISCGSCHKQENAFSDPGKKSIGTHGEETGFHSMPLFNIAWMDRFFWDGRAPSREIQALKPVTNPLEMDMTWQEAVERLKKHEEYPALFEKAFGTGEIDSMLVARALVQFEMTIVSANSKFDRYNRGEAEFTPLESMGYDIFASFDRGDCTHCHLLQNPQLADNSFHNNGLDAEEDLKPGLYNVTGIAQDYGKFKTPSLRNLAFTAPYMHDGRFATLEEVVNFYSSGVHKNSTVDPLMEFAHQGGVQLDSLEKKALIAFLLTLSDSSLITHPAFSDPAGH